MTLKRTSPFQILWRVLAGLFVLAVGYSLARTELILRGYKQTFQQLEHPAGSALLDSFALEMDYYPATYVDDSIRLEPAYLVGELRSYDGEWPSLEGYYHNRQVKVGDSQDLSVWALPLEVHGDGQKQWLEFPGGFSYGPFEADVLAELQAYYASKIILERAPTNIYVVYFTVHP